MADEEELPEAPGVYTLKTDAGDKGCSIGYGGKAVAEYANGDVYEGQFANGERHGRGVYTYRDTGARFEGSFANNLKTGLGRMTYKNGAFYHGFFTNGLREGEGTFKYAGGDIYSGMWKQGKKHGKGTYVFGKTKYELKGDWHVGQIYQGTWTFTDGTQYMGMFKHQKPCGDGVWHTSKGAIVEGAYVQQVVPIDDEDTRPDGTPPIETKTFWKTATIVDADE